VKFAMMDLAEPSDEERPVVVGVMLLGSRIAADLARLRL